MRVGCSEDLVTCNFSCDNLADDVSLCESNYQSVFWCIVLVLSLSDQLLSGIVIGLRLLALTLPHRKPKTDLARSSTLVLCLESREVWGVLDAMSCQEQFRISRQSTYSFVKGIFTIVFQK